MLVSQWLVRKLALWFLRIIHNHVSQSEKCIIKIIMPLALKTA